MAIQWSDDLATGVEEIDSQHKAIFARINMLLDTCNQGKAKEEIRGVITFLEEYVLMHFQAEERQMLKAGYPEYRPHKAQHEEFIGKLTQLKNMVDTEGIGVHTVITTNQLLVGWLTNHIRKVDARMAATLKARQ